jgi:hypothetical protein
VQLFVINSIITVVVAGWGYIGCPDYPTRVSSGHVTHSPQWRHSWHSWHSLTGCVPSAKPAFQVVATRRRGDFHSKDGQAEACSTQRMELGGHQVGRQQASELGE